MTADWYAGTMPANVALDASALVGSTYAFTRYRSRRRIGLRVGRGASLCDMTVLDVGPRGAVVVGDFALVNAARIVCDGTPPVRHHVIYAQRSDYGTSRPFHVVTADALELDPADRLRLAAELIDSVEGPAVPHWEEVWSREIARRSAEAATHGRRLSLPAPACQTRRPSPERRIYAKLPFASRVDAIAFL